MEMENVRTESEEADHACVIDSSVEQPVNSARIPTSLDDSAIKPALAFMEHATMDQWEMVPADPIPV